MFLFLFFIESSEEHEIYRDSKFFLSEFVDLWKLIFFFS